MIQSFSSQNDVLISQIKNNIYRRIVDGNWWNLDAFFSDLTLDLLGNNSTLMKELSKGIQPLIKKPSFKPNVFTTF